MKRSACILTIIVVAADYTVVAASTELPGPYDARSAALGGTGVALADNASAAYHNPAALEQIGRFSVTAGFFPWSPQIRAPIAGPGTEMESSGLVPLFFAGAAYRVVDRVVVGLAAYPASGLGSRYSNVEVLGGADMELQIYTLEATLPVSVKLASGLSVAAGPRFSFVSQQSTSPLPGSTTMAEQELSGVDFTGITVGLHYTPIHEFSVGVSYRSRVSVETSGTTKVDGVELDTRSEFSSPHAFRLGLAGRLLNDRLIVTADIKYLLYSDSSRALTTTIVTPDGEDTSTIPLNWEDVFSLNMGLEYRVLASLPIRIGYAVSTSATPRETASVFTTPPGLLHSFHAGVGVAVGDFDIDAGGYYTFGGDDVEPSEASLGGDYSLTGLFGGVSATYGF